MTRSYSKLPRSCLPEGRWCVRRTKKNILNLKVYEVIPLGMAVEARADRDEANPAGTRVVNDE